MRVVTLFCAWVTVACASSPAPTPSSPVGGVRSRRPAARAPRAPVAVSGLEGTLTAYQVRDTMERRYEALDACYAVQRLARVAGRAVFAIHVLRDGRVGGAHYESSDLGDRALERCLLQVVLETRFPSPHGGEADVKWSVMLEPQPAGPGPERWPAARVHRVVKRRAPQLRKDCGLPDGGPTYTITAYVNRRGRVVSAGVVPALRDEAARLDCIAQQVERWRMPRPRQRLAKVRFDVR